MPRFVGHIELAQVLGNGGFGRVYLGHDTKNKCDVAVKIIDKELIRANRMEEYVNREIAIMKRLQHPHVIKLRSVVEMPNTYCLVMELASNGELFDKIVNARRFDEKTARCYFQQLISAVYYCHCKGVIHRDLKAENLLLGERGMLKVCDFGLSRYTLRNGVPDQNITFMSLAGSPDYQSPEMINPEADGYLGEPCDVWSCGVILFFMLTGFLPFSAHSDDQHVAELIRRGTYDRNNKYLTPGVASLISKILTVDVSKRITVQGIIEDPWFAVDLDPELFPASAASPMGSLLGSASPAHDSPKTTTVETRCSDSIVATLHRAFHSCNVDRSGRLKREEIRDVLIALNQGPVADEEVQGVMECFKLEDGCITEEEFVQGWAAAEKRLGGRLPLASLVNIFHYNIEKEMLSDLRRAFDKLDTNHNGLFTAENVMSIPELNLSSTEAEQLIAAMDTRKSGSVTFEDFVRGVMSTDIMQFNKFGTKLQRVRELFDAVDRSCMMSYLNTGFTVAGFREQIAQKLLKDGGTSDCQTKFDEGDGFTMYLHGVYAGDAKGRRLEVGVQLLPAATGYTKVLSYRINGKTEVFHDWFGKFRQFLRDEIVQCAEDTSIKGEPELL